MMSAMDITIHHYFIVYNKTLFPKPIQPLPDIKKNAKHSYRILCINLVKDVQKAEQAAKIIMEHIQLPEENYRLGKTKVFCPSVFCCFLLSYAETNWKQNLPRKNNS